MNVLMISRPTLFSVPGGDTVQLTETANALKEIGAKVSIRLADEKIDYKDFDLIHFFNVIRPNNIIPHIKRSKLPYVVSTIFVDYTEVEKVYRGRMAKVIYKLIGVDGMEYLKSIARFLKNNEGLVDQDYFKRGHRKSVEYVLKHANYLLPNSNSEFNRLKKRYNFETEYRVVPNAVESSFFNNGSQSRTGVICVARIEPIKNQLNLIKALKGQDISLKIIGKPSPNHHHYLDLCKEVATENIQFLGHLSKEDTIEEYKKAKVHILPSWFETTGLSSLEAAASSCVVVITNKGDTSEYFENHVAYCDPENPESILKEIKKALKTEPSPLLINKIKNQYSWKHAAEKTLEVYQLIL